jgi:predicted dehydrogenase
VETLRAAIIGLGVGEQHIAGYERVKGCRVTALCDVDPEKRAMAAERYPDKRVVADAMELLTDPDVDAVSVASYDDAHRDQIVAALEHGKHVFAEKPVCLFEHEARDIRSAMDAHPGLLLSSNLILRRSPRFIELRERVASGRLGELFYAEAEYDYGRLEKITEGWRGKQPFYSAVYGGSVHMVDLVLWLTGDRVVEVEAFGNAIASRESGFGNFDLVAALLRFESGLVSKVTVNFGCVRPHFHGLALYGTAATFVNDVPDGRLYTSRDPEVPPEPVTSAYPGAHKGDLVEGFARAIVNGGAPPVTTDEVFDVMSVCFAIERAAHEGRVVPVAYV